MIDGTHRGWRRPKVWVPVVLVVFVVVSGIALRLASRASTARKLAEIRKEGLPISALELDTWYKRVPLEDNAAHAILDATLIMVTPGKDLDDSSTGEFETSGPLPQKLVEAIASYVSGNQSAIEKIEAAAQLTKSRYSIDLSRGAWTLLPHLASLKQTVIMMKWAVVQSSIEGNVDEAVRRFKAGVGVANSLSAEPLLVTSLVRVACLGILLPALERIANDHPLSAEQAREIARLLEKTEKLGREALHRAMVGERAMGVEYFDLSFQEFDKLGVAANSYADPIDGYSMAAIYALRRTSGMNELDRSFYLEAMKRWVDATQLEFPGMLRESKSIDEWVAETVAKRRMRYLLSSDVLSQLGGAAQKEALMAARLRCARMGMAIEQFRAQHDGRVPNLAELESEYPNGLPRDPVDGAPLEFRLNSDKGYHVRAHTSTILLNEGRRKTNAFAAGFVVKR